MAMYGPPPGPPQGPPFGPPQGYGPPQGAAPMPPQPPKKGLSTGCLVVIFGGLGLLGLIGVIVIVAGYRLSQDKDVQNAFGALGDSVKIMAEAQSAPGTDELRALGCDQAFALDPMKMAKIADRFTDAGAPPPRTPSDIDRMVMCQVGAFGAAPTCDDAARAYVKGAAPTRSFTLSVQQQGSSRPHCSGVYSPAGAPVAPMGGASP